MIINIHTHNQFLPTQSNLSCKMFLLLWSFLALILGYLVLCQISKLISYRQQIWTSTNNDKYTPKSC